MVRALPWMLAVATCACAASLTACSDDAGPNFGPANGLNGQTPPEPQGTQSGMSDSGNPPPGDGGTTTGDSGMTTGDGGGGDGPVTQSCNGVTWSGTIYPLFAAAGTGQCASAMCHGAIDTPTIPDGNAGQAYTSLQGASVSTVQGTKPYIATTGNLADSAMECNLSLPSNQLGICSSQPSGMPEQPGTLSTTDKQTIEAWLKCGAPNN